MNLKSLWNSHQSFLPIGLMESLSLVFDREDESRKKLVASFVSELQSQPNLAEWVLSLASHSRHARADALNQAARTFNRDWSTFGVASTLRRLADRSSHYAAVIRELRATHAQTSDVHSTIETSAMAHAV